MSKKGQLGRGEMRHGGLRVQVVCPCCGGGCRVARSQQVTKTLRNSAVQCLDPSCGWSGVAATEIIRTISPASPVYQEGAPPALSVAEIGELVGSDKAVQPQLIE